MKIRCNSEVALSGNELLDAFVEIVNRYPKLLEVAEDVIKRKGHHSKTKPLSIRCPFGPECRDFPCITLHCNNDMMDGDGRTWRMS